MVISSISAKKTKRTRKQLPGTSYLISLNTQKKTLTYGNGNPGSGLGQTQKYGGVELVHRISVLPS